MHSPLSWVLRLTSLSLTFVCLLTIACQCFAQTDTATISGTVLDKSGAVVPGVQIQVTNVDTNLTVTTTTNNSGVYVLPGLKPGRYNLVATKSGFKQITVTDLT